MQEADGRTAKILEQWCSVAPRSISQQCAGCSEQQPPDWSQWPKEIDAITKRPRTPNDPYTDLSKTMVDNIRRDPGAHFRLLGQEDPSGVSKTSNATKTRHFRERYADIINKHLLRGQPTSQNFGIITPDKYFKEAQEPYTTCPQEAFEKWPGQMAGQLWMPDAKLQKGGLATKSHQFGEERERFTTIDMYRRPNTNCPGPCTMKFGRPGQGYYLQRYPNSATYFNSEIALNTHDVLQDIWPKTSQEYKERNAQIREDYARRDEQWPFISEYANRYGRKVATEHIVQNPRDKKLVEQSAQARTECEFLEA